MQILVLKDGIPDSDHAAWIIKKMGGEDYAAPLDDFRPNACARSGGLIQHAHLLFVGAVMDIFSATVLVLPLLLPLALRYGIDPLHFGVIFLANLEIGYLTPPVGINLFLASQRFNKPVPQVFRSTGPFLLIMLLWLALVTYVPVISLWWR